MLATVGNLNNDIGVPLTLLRLAPEHRYAVVEMGMNHAGEIRYLSRSRAPTSRSSTMPGPRTSRTWAHARRSRGRKARSSRGSASDGTAVINADDHFAPLWRRPQERAVRSPSRSTGQADVRGRCTLRADGSTLELQTPAGSGTVELAVAGEHNARNALAAAAAAVALGVGIDAIVGGLAAYRGIKGRLQPKAGAAGAHLIDDTYNANPDSVAAAISVLAAAPGRRVLVLGDMGELGSSAAALHAEVGDFAKVAGIDELFALGTHVGARGQGLRRRMPVIAAACRKLVEALRPGLGPQVTVLVKGSRFMQMERVVAALAAPSRQIGRRSTSDAALDR